LSIPLAGGAQYYFEAGLGTQQSTGTQGIQAGIQYTVASGSVIESQCEGTQAQFGTVTTRVEAFATAGNLMNIYVGSGIVRFTGIIITGSSGGGTLTVQAKNITPSVGQVQANSFLEVIRIR
jgi:hypothetical protein